ncbi:MAG: hypothetical protein IKW86_06130 [Salinivirgaceae bacterium]|nr:hypothetical protein [Salinivirgaceae bacterium]
MASKRQLKNDICFIVKELVSECIAYTMIVPNANLQEVENLINDILDFYGSTLSEVNAVRKATVDERGDNMKAIRHDVSQKVGEFVGRMAKLSEKKD